jgi:hypothetical protein
VQAEEILERFRPNKRDGTAENGKKKSNAEK